MPKPLSQMNWSLIRSEAWNKGPIIIFMGPTAIPIGIWFFLTMLPSATRVAYPGLDFLATIAAIMAGFAIDLGVVRIATGKPTHQNRWFSLTTWVPVIVWLMGCVILWDWYYTFEKGVFSTLAHLAFPTISLVMALYWAFEKGYEDTIAAPLHAQIESLTIQLEAWADRLQLRVDEATQELKARVNELTGQLQSERARADQHERLGNEIKAILDRVGETHAQSIAELRTQFQRTLADQRTQIEERAAQEIQQIRSGAVEQCKTDRAEIDRLTTELNNAIERLNQAPKGSTFKYATMAHGIRALLAEDPSISPERLIKELEVREEQIPTFRTQVSQIRRSMADSNASMAA
jgi:hypothetical protein